MTSASFFDSAISLRNSGVAIWSKSWVRFVPQDLATPLRRRRGLAGLESFGPSSQAVA